MFEIPPNIRGLIFDCDGTIADTMPLHYRAWEAAMGRYGATYPKDLFLAMAGIPTPESVEMLNEKFGYRMPVQEAADLKEKLYGEMIVHAKPIEVVMEIVRRYAGVLPMAVATGASRDICGRTLAALKIRELFAAVVTADDVVHGKPAPDIFLEAARRIGVEGKACCAFEDGDLGLRAARAAGMIAVDVRPWMGDGNGGLRPPAK